MALVKLKLKTGIRIYHKETRGGRRLYNAPLYTRLLIMSVLLIVPALLISSAHTICISHATVWVMLIL